MARNAHPTRIVMQNCTYQNSDRSSTFSVIYGVGLNIAGTSEVVNLFTRLTGVMIEHYSYRETALYLSYVFNVNMDPAKSRRKISLASFWRRAH